MNILITNIGRRGYLVDFIKENADFKGKVFVSDCDNTASGLYGTNDGFFILPKPVENEILYVKSLINVCKQNNIDAVLPVIDPEIYIFDDSFSALDYKTDSTLRSELKKYTKDATVMIVAQRIGTILNADKIVVLDNGKCVGIGTHKELMKKCKVYKEIALSQVSKEELENV